MNEPIALSSNQLMELFRSRGMIVSEQDIEKINHINYYKLKEFARPLAKIEKTDEEIKVNYNGITFQEVLRRYYQDKNLRIYLLHAIEKIEVSIKTAISHEMGLKYGAFGYLNFMAWSNRSKYTRFQIEEKQHRLKKNILYNVKRSNSPEFAVVNNKDSDGFPTVWLAIDILTFGDIVIISDMMNNSLLRKISTKYNASSEEFLSWIKCLHFVRNICAHNSNLIDIKIKTKPKYRKEWVEHLCFITSKDGRSQTPTNRLAVIICIVMYFVMNINIKYKWANINSSIRNLCNSSDANANLIGFRSYDDARIIGKIIKQTLE